MEFKTTVSSRIKALWAVLEYTPKLETKVNGLRHLDLKIALMSS